MTFSIWRVTGVLDCNYPEQNQGWFVRLPYIKRHDVMYDNRKEAHNVHITKL